MTTLGGGGVETVLSRGMVALLLIGSGPNLSVRFAAKTLSLGAILRH